MIKGLKIFDCTLREVGYQTGWHFTDKFVRDAYKFAQGKGIDYLELGFFHQEAADPDRGSTATAAQKTRRSRMYSRPARTLRSCLPCETSKGPSPLSFRQMRVSLTRSVS